MTSIAHLLTNSCDIGIAFSSSSLRNLLVLMPFQSDLEYMIIILINFGYCGSFVMCVSVLTESKCFSVD